MEPLTTALIGAFVAAASALAGGVAEAAGDDTWRAAKAKLAKLGRLEKRASAAAFDTALREALATLRTGYAGTPAAEPMLALLRDDARLRQLAVEELVLSARPNLGRLLDHYRRELRFAALLRGVDLPPWTDLEPALRLFLGVLLPQALAEQKALRPLLLEQAELAALDQARATSLVAEDTAGALRGIEALLHELTALPKLAQTISTGPDGTIAQVQQIVVHGHYYAVPVHTPPDLAALYRHYRGFLIETYGMLDFRGIAQVQNIVRLRLEAVYVPLMAQAHRRTLLPKAAPEQSFLDRRARNIARVADRTETGVFARIQAGATAMAEGLNPAHDFVRDTPFLVLLGDPGAGKSTLVRYLMLALAEGHARERLGLEGEWLPILFPVAAFAEARERQPDLAPLDYLSEYYKGLSQPDYGPLFQRALLGGRALLLLDGLDEVRTHRLELAFCLEAFVREWDAPGNRFVATSRIAGYDDAPLNEALFARATIQPFADDDIRRFCEQWSYAYERAGAEELPTDPALAAIELQRRAAARASSLQAAVFATSNVTDLARNPLLLTILALIHNQGTRLPDRRVDLYRLCVEALAETWNRARSLSGREINVFLGDQKLDERFVVNLLGPAALWIHAEQPGGLVEQNELERQLAQTLILTDGLPQGKAQRLADDFIDLVRCHTGLLQERGHRRYGFLHLTFEEYLAARALIESATVDDADALILQRCTDAGWREVLRLALASVSQKEAQRLLLLLLAAPTPAETRGQPVVLAGECLLDIGRNGATQRAWSAVIEHLVALPADPQATVAVRVEGGHLLGRLGDRRLLDPRAGDAPIGGYWRPIEAGPFWYGDDTRRDEGAETAPLQRVTLPIPFKVARYPVTKAEYQRFIDDDGYNGARPWWTEQGRAFLAPGSQPYDDQEQPITLPRLWNDPQYNSPNQPVVGVSWYEAAAYCAWLTIQGHQAGWLPHGDQLRLPTSLEWERAARHTDKRRYPWGDAEPDAGRANYRTTGIGAPSPVGCFPQGAAVCGALDLVGNVWEWTATLWEQIDALEPQKDFTLVEGPVIRGGSYFEKLEHLCCGARDGYDAYSRYGDLGFRVIWSLARSE